MGVCHVGRKFCGGLRLSRIASPVLNLMLFHHHHQEFAHAVMNHLLARDGRPGGDHRTSDAVSGGI